MACSRLMIAILGLGRRIAFGRLGVIIAIPLKGDGTW